LLNNRGVVYGGSNAFFEISNRDTTGC